MSLFLWIVKLVSTLSVHFVKLSKEQIAEMSKRITEIARSTKNGENIEKSTEIIHYFQITTSSSSPSLLSPSSSVLLQRDLCKCFL